MFEFLQFSFLLYLLQVDVTIGSLLNTEPTDCIQKTKIQGDIMLHTVAKVLFNFPWNVCRFSLHDYGKFSDGYSNMVFNFANLFVGRI